MVNHGVKVVIGELEIMAEGYNLVPEENAVQFYRDTTFDHFPHIKVCDNALSDFGKLVLTGSVSEEKLPGWLPQYEGEWVTDKKEDSNEST